MAIAKDFFLRREATILKDFLPPKRTVLFKFASVLSLTLAR
jgi:hypothetical protein